MESGGNFAAVFRDRRKISELHRISWGSTENFGDAVAILGDPRAKLRDPEKLLEICGDRAEI
jgi:hypothetical protein